MNGSGRKRRTHAHARDVTVFSLARLVRRETDAVNIVGVDIGGTFTDLVGYMNGQIVTSKTSTVPADPTRGVAKALELADCEAAAVDEILHGSTIAINTVLERKGAKTALLTTAGFRDVYAIGRSNRIEAFNLFFKRPS
jgi:N-methylhydantoinase A